MCHRCGAQPPLGTDLYEGLEWRYSENYRRLRGTDDLGRTIGVDAASLDQDKASFEADVAKAGFNAKAKHVWAHWCDWRKRCPVCDENAAIIKAKRQADTVPPPPPLQIDEA